MISAAVERKPYVGALRRKMGKPVVLLGTSRLLVFSGQLGGCDNIKYPVLRPSACIVNVCLCTTEICNKNCCCYSP